MSNGEGTRMKEVKQSLDTISPPSSQTHTSSSSDPKRVPLWAKASGIPAALSLQPQQQSSGQSSERRFSRIERRQTVLEKRVAALELDNYWQRQFGDLMSSYRGAIYRISTGFRMAEKGFQDAQMAQAQTDALATQLFWGAISLAIAINFEWVFTKGFSKLGVAMKQIEKMREAVENPVNTLASITMNLAGVRTSAKSAEEGQTPSITPERGGGAGDALGFLTSSMETLEERQRKINDAFMERSFKMKKFTDKQWEMFGLSAQEKIYQDLFNTMKTVAKGVEDLKPENQIAKIIERYMWALWIRGQRDEEIKNFEEMDQIARASGSGPLPGGDIHRQEPQYDVGTDIERELTNCGVASAAKVTLTGHWYSSNEPGNWRSKLVQWAKSYHEPLNKE